MFPAMGIAATILWIRTSAMDGETIICSTFKMQEKIIERSKMSSVIQNYISFILRSLNWKVLFVQITVTHNRVGLFSFSLLPYPN